MSKLWASNTIGRDTCQDCGTFLKVKQGNTQYIYPDNPGLNGGQFINK